MDKLKYGCLLSFVQSVKLSCELKKKSFYRAMNAIYGKIGYVASADVVVEMIKTKKPIFIIIIIIIIDIFKVA